MKTAHSSPTHLSPKHGFSMGIPSFALLSALILAAPTIGSSQSCPTCQAGPGKPGCGGKDGLPKTIVTMMGVDFDTPGGVFVESTGGVLNYNGGKEWLFGPIGGGLIETHSVYMRPGSTYDFWGGDELLLEEFQGQTAARADLQFPTGESTSVIAVIGMGVLTSYLVPGSSTGPTNGPTSPPGGTPFGPTTQEIEGTEEDDGENQTISTNLPFLGGAVSLPIALGHDAEGISNGYFTINAGDSLVSVGKTTLGVDTSIASTTTYLTDDTLAQIQCYDGTAVFSYVDQIPGGDAKSVTANFYRGDPGVIPPGAVPVLTAQVAILPDGSVSGTTTFDGKIESFSVERSESTATLMDGNVQVTSAIEIGSRTIIRNGIRKRVETVAVAPALTPEGKVRRVVGIAEYEMGASGTWIMKSEVLATQEGTPLYRDLDPTYIESVPDLHLISREERVFPDTSSQPLDQKLRTTHYTYYTAADEAVDQPFGSETGGAKAGRLASVSHPDGSWTRYEYFTLTGPNRSVLYEITPWLDGCAHPSDATATNTRVVKTETVNDSFSGDTTSSEERLGGILVRRTESIHSILNDPNTGLMVARQVMSEYAGQDTTPSRTTVTLREALSEGPAVLTKGRIYSTKVLEDPSNSNSSAGESTDYAESDVLSQAAVDLLGQEITNITGLFAEKTRTQSAPDGTPRSQHLSIQTTLGEACSAKREWDATINDWRATEVIFRHFNPVTGEVTETIRNGVVVQSITPHPTDPNLEIHTDESGQQVVRSIQPTTTGVEVTTVLGSPAGTLPGINLSYPAQPERQTFVARYPDSEYGIIEEVGSSSLSISYYDLTGRLAATSDLSGGLNTNYSWSADGLTETSTTWSYQSSDTIVQTTTRFRDGRLKSVSGDVEVEEHHTYDLDAQGRLTETVFFGPHTTQSPSPRWQKTITDGLGRTLQQIRPAAPGSGVTEVVTDFVYDDAGRLERTTTTGLAPQVSIYEGGVLVRSGVALDGDLTLPVTSAINPTTVVETGFEEDQDGIWRVQISKSLRTSDGLQGRVQKTRTLVDLETGRQLVQRMAQDHSGTQTSVTESIVTPTAKLDIESSWALGSGVVRKSASVNGLGIASWVESNGTAKVVSKNTFDAQGNLSTTTSYSSEDLEVIDSFIGSMFLNRTVAGALSPYQEYEPYAVGRAGLVRVDDKGVSYAYDKLGRITLQWGADFGFQSGSYPVRFEYDAFGQRTKMHTYRSKGILADSQWIYNPLTMFASEPSDETTWTYDPGTGLLTGKADAADQSVQYTYFADGAVKTRQWARGVTTAYEYDQAGRPTRVSYSGGAVATPWATFSYHRDGTVASVTDAAGLHTVEENGAVATETLTTAPSPVLPSMPPSPSLLAGVSSTVTYDSQARRQAASVQWPSGGPGMIWSASYGYESSAGRLETASFDGIGTWTYGYHDARSTAIHHLTGPGNLRQDRRRPSSGTAEQQWYTAGGQTVMGWHYNTDPVTGHRTLAAPHTAAGTSAGPGNIRPSWAYGYNPRGEVASAEQFTNASGSYTVLPNRQWSYEYDAIGNRVTATEGGLTTTYTTNDLNQYTEIEHPRDVWVRGSFGSAESPLSARINGSAPTIYALSASKYWFQGIVSAASAGQEQKSVEIETLTNSNSVVSRRTSSVFIPAAITLPAYDEDGNLTNDGRWIYTWDAENRLVQMDTTPQAVAAGAPSQKLEFAYDHRSRRISKKVSEDMNGTWRLTQWRKFLYDGWNMIAELDALSDHAIMRTYAWGIDLGGSVDGQGGAGGVGGLLAVKHHGRSSTKTWSALSDANGNISGWWDVSTQTLTAQMEYDPFGNLIHDSTPEGLEISSVEFSSKLRDRETGLVYYGFRYYSAELGRWPNRDPIAEDGGTNLYGMVRNDPVNNTDELGLKITKYSVGSASASGSHIAGYSAYTTGNWAANLYVSKPIKEGNGWKVEVRGSLSLTMNYSTYDHDEQGRSSFDHEHVHEQIWGDNWNRMADAINGVETTYCSKECADLASQAAEAIANMYHHQNRGQNRNFDIQAYPKRLQQAGLMGQYQSEVNQHHQAWQQLDRQLDDIEQKWKQQKCSHSAPKP